MEKTYQEKWTDFINYAEKRLEAKKAFLEEYGYKESDKEEVEFFERKIMEMKKFRKLL